MYDRIEIRTQAVLLSARRRHMEGDQASVPVHADA